MCLSECVCVCVCVCLCFILHHFNKPYKLIMRITKKRNKHMLYTEVAKLFFFLFHIICNWRKLSASCLSWSRSNLKQELEKKLIIKTGTVKKNKHYYCVVTVCTYHCALSFKSVIIESCNTIFSMLRCWWENTEIILPYLTNVLDIIVLHSWRKCYLNCQFLPILRHFEKKVICNFQLWKNSVNLLIFTI